MFDFEKVFNERIMEQAAEQKAAEEARLKFLDDVAKDFATSFFKNIKSMKFDATLFNGTGTMPAGTKRVETVISSVHDLSSSDEIYEVSKGVLAKIAQDLGKVRFYRNQGIGVEPITIERIRSIENESLTNVEYKITVTLC